MTGSNAARPTWRPPAWLLLAFLALATWLARAPGVPRLLPHLPEPDAYVVQLAQDYRDDPALVEHVDYAERYPTLLARTLALLPWPGVPAGLPIEAQARAHLHAAAGPYLAGRWLVLALSLLTLPGTFFVARRLVGEPAAWLACGLVATSLMFALFSTQARPHAAQAAFALWAVWGCLRLAERPSLARGALAALLCGLAGACLQPGFATLAPLAAAGWLGGGRAIARLARAALWPLAAVAIALPFYPFRPAFQDGTLRVGGSGAHELNVKLDVGENAQHVLSWLWWHDPWLLLLTGAALAWLLVRLRSSARAAARRDVLVSCAYVLPYLALLLALDKDKLLERLLIPFLPWMAILSAWLATSLVGAARPRRLAFAAGLCLAPPAIVLARFDVVVARPDTMEQVAGWLVRQPDAPTASVLASPGLVLPAPYEARALAENLADQSGRASVWTKYQGTLPPPGVLGPSLRLVSVPAPMAHTTADEIPAWFERHDPTYVVVECSARNRFLRGGRAFQQLAEQRGERVYATAGEAPDVDRFGVLHYQSIRSLVARLFATERLGAHLEVWRIRRPDAPGTGPR